MEVKSEKKISDLCNMSWLKNNLDTSPEKELVPASSSGRKRKQKKSKNGSNPSKDTNFKNSDTVFEEKQKSPENQKPAILSVNATSVVETNTVWQSKSNAANTLFPEAQSLPIDILDENLQYCKAIEESLLTAQLEKFRLTPEKDKVNWADDSEEPGWGAVHSNLPEPSENNLRESEVKIEEKPHDNNNNSDNKANVISEVKKIDKYGRVDGYSERHLFMGKGARRREEFAISRENNRSEHTYETDSHGDKNRGHGDFQNRNFDDRQRAYRDFGDRSSNSFDNRGRYQKEYGEKKFTDNKPSNFEEKREYRNRNFQFPNQQNRPENNYQRSDNYGNRFDNQQRDRQYQRYNNYPRSENQSYENQSQRYGNNSQRYNNQQRKEEQFQSHARALNYKYRQFSNKVEKVDPPEPEVKTEEPIKVQENKLSSSTESVCEKNEVPEKMDPPKEETDEYVDFTENNVILNTRSSTPLLEETSSISFLQESYKDEETDVPETSETTSEKSEYQKNEMKIPFQVHPIPLHVIQTPGIMSPEHNMQVHNEMSYKMIPSSYIVPDSNPSHFPLRPEMIPSKSVSPPASIHNMDMRYFPQHPVNVVPNSPFMSVMNYPMGVPYHSCQIPVGNIPEINYPQVVNCHQYPAHYCQLPRVPLQNINCQTPMYPAQYVTPITSLPLPMTPISPDKVQSLKSHPFGTSDVKIATPVTDIGRSVSNLVSLCENLPYRRVGYNNCPPGFEGTAYSNTSQRKIAFKPARDYQRNTKSPGEFTDEKLKDIYADINSNGNNNLMKEEEMKSSRLQSGAGGKPSAPRPGFRVGLGRGKKIAPTT